MPNITSDTAHVYTEYSLNDPPPHPGHGWTRFVCISDTHSRRFPLPPGDVLLHSGDLSAGGKLSALSKTMQWLRELDYSHKVIIAGNHDMCLDRKWQEGGEFGILYGSFSKEEVAEARRLVEEDGMTYLEHNAASIRIGDRVWKIYGSPAAPFYSLGAFQYESPGPEANEIYQRIPVDIDVLLTHSPPNGILDLTRRNKHAGCSVLANTLPSLQQCRLHVFGHIHESHGAVMNPVTEDVKFGGVSVNAAMQRLQETQAIIVDLKN